MKKRLLLIATVAIVLLLIFHSRIQDGIESCIFADSEIPQAKSYQTYEAYKTAGKLTEQGYYKEETSDEAAETEPVVPVGMAHVTFAENSFLNVEYFSNGDGTAYLSTDDCYLAPGARIYAKVIEEDGPSSMYHFDRFRVWRYTDSGRKEAEALCEEADGIIEILEITEADADTELSIEPLGKYETRELMLDAYTKDDSGNQQNISGTWSVNGKKVTDLHAEVNPMAEYTVCFEYDANEYFYVSASPNPFYQGTDYQGSKGNVVFKIRESSDETEEYSVELSKYKTVEQKTEETRSVTINGEAKGTCEAGTSVSFTHLKDGDKIVVETDKEWSELVNNEDLVCSSEEPLQNGNYRYTLRVPEKEGQFTINLSEYKVTEYGELAFYVRGEEQTGDVTLSEGMTITCKEKSAKEGYWLGSDRTVTVEVKNEGQTKEALANIKFIERTPVTVELKQPKYGGTIYYYYNGEKIPDEDCEKYETFSGAKITMNFKAWKGWINNYKNGEIYEVDKDSKTVKIGGKDVNAAFTEDSEHKPTLTVILDKSVGKEMRFSFTASGMGTKNITYETEGSSDTAKGSGIIEQGLNATEKTWNNIKGSVKPINGEIIGTEENIEFSMSNRALPSGTAVKLIIKRTDRDGNTTSEIRLIDDMADEPEPIVLYSSKEEQATSDVWYKSIEVTVSVVDVEAFTEPPAPAHAAITVSVSRDGNGSTPLQSGDLVELAEKVTVAIKSESKSGYYVYVKNAPTASYTEDMKFSKYLNEIQNILEDHPVEKYAVLNLTPGDTQGTYTYTLDGKAVSGTTPAKPGQKLTVKYELTASGYKIDGVKGFLGKQIKTESIVVTADMDGETINRDTFEIRVIKEE